MWLTAKPGTGAGTGATFNHTAGLPLRGGPLFAGGKRMPTIVITGGSRGIGAETVRQFAQSGWRVLFTYLRSGDAARALAEETGAIPFRCDARSEEDHRLLAEEVSSRFPAGADALICNAGTAYAGLIQDMSVSEWDELFAVHVRGAFLATRALLPGMIHRQKGAILYISSMWGQVGASCEAAYSACKAALIGLTKALAKEAGPSQVRVNCLCPGVIDTDMMRAFSPEDKAALREETPLGRLGTPRDIARAARFLCGEEASFITGQVLGVNGGFVI